MCLTAIVLFNTQFFVVAVVVPSVQRCFVFLYLFQVISRDSALLPSTPRSHTTTTITAPLGLITNVILSLVIVPLGNLSLVANPGWTLPCSHHVRNRCFRLQRPLLPDCHRLLACSFLFFIFLQHQTWRFEAEIACPNLSLLCVCAHVCECTRVCERAGIHRRQCAGVREKQTERSPSSSVMRRSPVNNESSGGSQTRAKLRPHSSASAACRLQPTFINRQTFKFGMKVFYFGVSKCRRRAA